MRFSDLVRRTTWAASDRAASAGVGFVRILALVIGNRSAVHQTASGSVTGEPASAGVSAKLRESVHTACASGCAWRVRAGKGLRPGESRGMQYETQWGWKLR